MKSSWVRAKAGVWVGAPQVGHHWMAGGRPTSSSVSPFVPDSLRVEGGPEGGPLQLACHCWQVWCSL